MFIHHSFTSFLYIFCTHCCHPFIFLFYISSCRGSLFLSDFPPSTYFFLIHECRFYRAPWDWEITVKKKRGKNKKLKGDKILGVRGYLENLTGIFKCSSTSLKYLLWTYYVQGTARCYIKPFKISKFLLFLYTSFISLSPICFTGFGSLFEVSRFIHQLCSLRNCQL